MMSPVARRSGLRRLFGVILAMLVVALPLVGCSSGGTYPTKAIVLICPSGAGGASDLAGRPVADFAAKKWGQSINLAYKTGAGGTQGTVEGLQSAPDGYTLMLVGNSQGTTNPATTTDLPYKWDQPATIARLVINPMVLSVPASSKWKTAQELLDDVKKNPKQYKYGTQSPAGPSVMATAQWLKGAGVNPAEIDRVVAGGGGAMITELAGAHSDWAVGSVSEVVELVKGGKLRALMVTGGKRASQLPDVPTPQELGYPWYTWVGYTGLWGPANLPESIINQWVDVIKEAHADKAFNDQMETVGAVPAFMDPKQFKDFLKTSYDETLGVVTELGLRK